MIWPKKNYKSILKNSKTEAEIQRENFIKENLNYENEKSTRSKLPKWLISLGVYLSREGPKLSGLEGGIESLRKQQIENHYLSKLILHYDIKAIEFERNILNIAKHEFGRNNFIDTTNITGDIMSDNKLKESIKQTENKKTYNDLCKTKINVFKKENSILDSDNKEDYFSKYKPIINVVNKKDENIDLDISLERQTNSNEVFYDAEKGDDTNIKDTILTSSPKTPQTERPKTPLSQNLSSYTENTRKKNDSLQSAKENESFSSNSLKKQKINLKTQERNRKFLKRLKESSDKSFTEESNIIQSNIIQTYNDSETFDNSESFIANSTLVKEYTTPSLDTPNVVYGSGKKIKIINCDKNIFSPLEGSSNDFFNDNNNFNQNIEETIREDKKKTWKNIS